MKLNPEAYRARIEEVAKILDVTNVDLTRFRLRGGKIILAHGTEDDFIAPGNTEGRSVLRWMRHVTSRA
jgi:hypothetical protein